MMALCAVEELAIHNRFKGAIRSDPHVWIVQDVLPFELEGRSVPDVVADIFLRPWAVQVGHDAGRV
jgi:hypothetical protein